MLKQETLLVTLNRVLGHTGRVRKGVEAMYLCPECKHHKRKLECNLLTGKYHCWVCNFSGLSFFSLFKKLGAPEDCYKVLGGIKFKKDASVLDNHPISSHQDLINLFKDFDIPEQQWNNLPKEFIPMSKFDGSFEYKNAINYLKKRKITTCDIFRYNIGFCKTGEYANRIIIPSYDKLGNLNFYTGRSISDKAYLKYKNCEFSKNIVGFESTINFKEDLTIVEGPTDALTVRYNCVPLFGKSLSEKLKTELVCNKPPRINILLDDDALRASVGICEILLNNNVNVFLIELQGKDPNVLGFEKTWEIIDSTEPLTFKGLMKYKLNL